MIRFFPCLEGRHLWGRKFPHSGLPHENFFGQSREVAGAMVGALGLRAGDVILAPGSLCWDALSPMLAQGIIIRCYPLDSRLCIDISALKAMLCPKTKVIYIVHYFGYPQPNISSLRDWCSREGLMLVEDCALCLFDSRSQIGRWGDISFFSLWKYFPIPNGAIALVRNGVKIPPPTNQPDTLWFAKRVLRLLACMGLYRDLVSTLVKNRPPVSGVAAHEPPGLAELSRPTTMSAISKYILSRCNLLSISDVRRRNYSYLVKGLSDIRGIEPIWQDFPLGSTPFALPIRVTDPVSLQRKLAARGVETEISINRFFRNHSQIEGEPKDFKVIGELADHVISLPIHQGMSIRDVERLICVIHEIS